MTNKKKRQNKTEFEISKDFEKAVKNLIRTPPKKRRKKSPPVQTRTENQRFSRPTL
jgi:hypothetical protein